MESYHQKYIYCWRLKIVHNSNLWRNNTRIFSAPRTTNRDHLTGIIIPISVTKIHPLARNYRARLLINNHYVNRSAITSLYLSPTLLSASTKLRVSMGVINSRTPAPHPNIAFY